MWEGGVEGRGFIFPRTYFGVNRARGGNEAGGLSLLGDSGFIWMKKSVISKGKKSSFNPALRRAAEINQISCQIEGGHARIKPHYRRGQM